MDRSGHRATGRAFASAIAFFLMFAASGEADAQAQPRKPVTATPAQQPAATARFFTLNDVLNKHGLGGPVRVAAKLPATLNDSTRMAEPAGPEPFGLYGFRAPDGRLWKLWRSLETELQEETAGIAACIEDAENCSKEAVRFLALAGEIRAKSGTARLETANRLVNAGLRYMSDIRQHGQADLWTAPLKSLVSGRGDCEDYAILKYALLLRAGAKPESLRIVLLRDAHSRQDHAVLAAEEGGEWFVLDNLRAGAVKTAELPHYTPLYALNHKGVSMLAARYAAAPEAAGEETFAPAGAETEWGFDTADFAEGSAAELKPLLF
jgi:predicted transglutaminase-like cysteine proteinase